MVKNFSMTMVVLLAVILQSSAQTVAPIETALVPQPSFVKVNAGQYMITESTRIGYAGKDSQVVAMAERLAAYIKSKSGLQLPVVPTVQPLYNMIFIGITQVPDSLGKEGYTLTADKAQVAIKAKSAAGLFYGTQTLYQLIKLEVQKKLPMMSIPLVQISDKPRFEWRGSMLDCGRIFYSVDFIKKYLDYMAMHKLNTFHWHLTEDHGWRIESKKYPKLNEISSWRTGTQFDHSPERQINQSPHGGYYTQEQIRDIVQYAAERFITVVPEVEMPGHTLAVLAAYPELSCTGGPFKMPVQWGIQEDIFCAGNEQTFEFLEGILTEVAELFPGKMIHIGGDEAPKKRWKECPKCQARIQTDSLKDEQELQSYFIKRIEKFLLTKEKNVIGWDEILEGGLAPNAAVMSWRGIQGGIEAAKQKHAVVMSPTDFMYFDYYQGEPYLEPVAIGGMLTLEKVYSYEPVPAELTAAERKYIKGVQANIWSEFIHTPEKVEYMAFPRLAALAELAWTPAARKDWENFTKRMETQYKRYEDAGIQYSKSAKHVWQKVELDTVSNTATISLRTQSYKPEIRYTTDGNEPTKSSPLYTEPFQISLPSTVKAVVFEGDQPVGKISVQSVLTPARL
jgi:hexosaminidase